MMKSVNLSFKAWFQENLRRYWSVCLILFAGLMGIGFMPLALNFNRYEEIASYGADIMYGNVISIVSLEMLIVWITIVVSASTFSFLHDTAGATALHSLPISRGRLYWSTVTSGAVVIALPIICTGLLLMTIQNASLSKSGEVEIVTHWMPAVAFSTKNCLFWIWRHLIVALYTYSICAFAAVISGTVWVHVLMSIFLNLLIPTLDVVLRGLANTFLYGVNNDVISSYVHKLHPYLYSSANGAMVNSEVKNVSLGAFTGKMTIYLVVAALILVAGRVIYSRVKLERVKSACFFPIVADIISVLLTFLGATAVAAFTTAMTNVELTSMSGKVRFMVLFVILSVIGFILCRMIAESSFKVFHVGTVKKFLVYAVLMIVLMGVLVFDVTGISKKVPKVEDVKTATISLSDLRSNEVKLTDAKQIELVTNLHASLIGMSEVKHSNDAEYNTVPVVYTLKNGKTMKRSYSLYKADKKPMADLAEIYKAGVFQKKGWTVPVKQIGTMEVNTNQDDGLDSYKEATRKHYEAIAKAYQKDYEALSYEGWLEQVFQPADGYPYDITVESVDEGIYITFPVTKDFKHTLKLLRELKYIK